MANSIDGLKAEVRDIAGTKLSDGALDTAIERAKRRIKIQTGQQSVDWYASTEAEEALFWTTCLFTKIADGELDAQTFRSGSIEFEHLSSEEAGEWAKNSQQAIDALAASAGSAFAITAPTRDDRVYGEDDGGDATEL